MGYQPALDGLRALSVVLVILYHVGVLHNAGLPTGVRRPWFFNGGFLGVEVFFVVSGYLITTLLLEERERTGTISLRSFWGRRFRRLMPALWTTIIATSVWAMVWGRPYLHDLRADAFFGATYLSNFQQLAFKVSYFGGLPHLLRHLWSLAVEEHFYLLFPPLAAWMLRRPRSSDRRLLRVVVPLCLVSVVSLAVVWQRPVERLGADGVVLDDLRQNWAYLSTFTRIGGILIGVALAVVWSPWRRRPVFAGRLGSGTIDAIGIAAVLGIIAAALSLSNDSALLYHGGLTAVSLLSAIAIGVVVHPGSRILKRIFASRPMAAIGRRSYGLYLWHWPIMVGPLGGRPILDRIVLGLPLTFIASELCYQLIETPIRRGAFARWRVPRAVIGAGLVAVVGVVSVGIVALQPGNDSGASDAVDSASTDTTGAPAQPTSTAGLPTSIVTTMATSMDSSAGVSTTSAAPTTTLAALPRRVVVVGDSEAGAIARNVPEASKAQFRFYDGEVSGCGVFDAGQIVSVVHSIKNFSACRGWQDNWVKSANRGAAEVVLIVLGAWDVFGLKLGDRVVDFASPEWDAMWTAAVRSGIDRMLALGASVALLEPECFRPHSTGGPGTFVFPERADDSRTRHVDSLMRRVAEAYPTGVTYVSGPVEWCNGSKISTNLFYRYDGVHPTPMGADLIYRAIKDRLLSIPVDPARHAVKPQKTRVKQP
jgi:peptidoglycan/LPS O-acetylase OafA/YrhL